MGRHKKPLDRLKDHIRLKMLADLYTPGMRLPAINTLGSKFNMKYNTARNALLELVQEGYLEHSRYAFVVKPWRKNPDGLKIAVFMQFRLEQEGLYHQALLGMLKRAFEQNMHFSLHQVSFPDITEEKLHDACQGMDGALLLSSYDATLPDFVLPIPGAGVMVPRGGKKRFSTVNIHAEQAVQLAVGYFRKRHVKDVVMYSAPRRIFTDRARAFAEAFTQTGGNILYFRTGNAVSDIQFPEKAGFFCTSDFIAAKLCSHYAQCSGGVWLPDERPFLSIDGNRFLMNWPESGKSFSTITCNWQQAGALALQELQNLIADPAADGRELAVSAKLSSIPRSPRK